MPPSSLTYTTRVTQERFGTEILRVETLEDLNKTIDDLFELLEREGRPELLESLCPYFGVVWPAARALTERLSEDGALARPGLRVLELGSGLALPSLLAARRGARVTVTDFHPEVPRFLERNLAHNGIPSGQVGFRALDWKNAASLPPPGAGAWDLVIASDVLYEKEHPGLLASVLAQVMGPETVAWVADPARPYLQAFTDAARALGLAHEIEVRTAHDTPKPKEVFLLKLRRLAS